MNDKDFESLRARFLNDIKFMDSIGDYVNAQMPKTCCDRLMEWALWFGGTAWPIIVAVLKYRGYIK